MCIVVGFDLAILRMGAPGGFMRPLMMLGLRILTKSTIVAMSSDPCSRSMVKLRGAILAHDLRPGGVETTVESTEDCRRCRVRVRQAIVVPGLGYFKKHSSMDTRDCFHHGSSLFARL